MRETLTIITIAVLGFFGYQYADHGTLDPDVIFEPAPPEMCPNGIGPGDVVEHITGNYKGVILQCRPSFDDVHVHTGMDTTYWKWEHIIELREER